MRDRFCQWRARPVSAHGRMSPELEAWVLASESLTVRLRRRCGAAFSVLVVAEGWRIPELDEARRLRISPRRLVWIREVVLRCHERPLIFARTVIPARSLRGGNRVIRVLGNRPLGELLFDGRGSRRDPREVAHVRPDDWMMYRVQRAVPNGGDSGLWARRVLHYLHGRPLLVAEVFFPELIEDDD